MANTVSKALEEYRVEKVDLSATDSDGAKTSKEYLVEQIANIAENTDDFPKLYTNNWYQSFGSFARKTKTQPLNDVDIMPILHGCGGTQILFSGYSYGVKIYSNEHNLWNYTDDGFVNSTKVLNKLKLELMNIPNYSSTEINKRGEAIVVNLNSYDWSFDVVPGFAVSDNAGGIGHFLIPDGSGQWKRTDPRIDQERITQANQNHNGNLVPLIRLIKYWNENSRHTQKISSYYLETMLVNGFFNVQPLQSLKSGITTAFSILQYSVLSPCPDPKGFGPNLDSDLDFLQKANFNQAAKNMHDKLIMASLSELVSDQKTAVNLWGEVFPNFPQFTD